MFGRLLNPILDALDVRKPNIDSESLIEKIKSTPEPVVKHNFGIALGSVYFIKPDGSIDLEALIEQINKQPDPRKSRSHMAWLTDGPILSSRSGKDAIRHHKLFLNTLSRPDDHIHYLLSALNDLNITSGNRITLRTLTTGPLHNMLAKALLGLDALPQKLQSAFAAFATISGGAPAVDEAEDDNTPVTDQMTDFAKNNHNLLRSMYYTSALSFHPETQPLRDARAQYIEAVNELIDSQVNNIISNILAFSKNEKIVNILSLSVIEVIKERNPYFLDARNREFLNQYLRNLAEDKDALSLLMPILEDPYIHTVPANLFASNNLIWLISAIFYALGNDANLITSLHETFSKHHLEKDLSNIRSVIEADKKENGILHRLYLEGLRLHAINEPLDELKFDRLFRFYLSDPLKVNADITIPGKSMVCILNGMTFVDEKIWGEKPEVFNPARFFGSKEQVAQKVQISHTSFSRIPRICPAHVASEYIAKTFITYIVSNFDLKLFAKAGESDISKIRLELTQRELEEKERKVASM